MCCGMGRLGLRRERRVCVREEHEWEKAGKRENGRYLFGRGISKVMRSASISHNDVSGRAFWRPFPRDTWVFQTVFDDMNVIFRSSSSTTPSPVTTGTMHMAWSCSLLLYAMMQLDRVKNVHTTNHQSQTRKKALTSGIQITHLSSGWACRLWLFESDM